MNEVKGKAAGAIGLALSGGGVRAAAFHAGVLRYLAEQGLLEKVVHVSSVSGGSLFVGMVFQHGNYRWPGSETYLREVFPHVRQTLTTQSLQCSAILRLVFNPLNWRFILSRANVLAQAIRGLWGVKAPLRALDDAPVWSINCTTGETGRRYRYKNGTMGDYELGYAEVDDFGLARAMAISAAFPGGIGPLTLRVKKFHWKKRKQWNAPEPEAYQPPFNRLHLYDGGLYDNLGIEPMFDVGQQLLKEDETLPSDITYLLVSDGGAPLAREGIPHPLNPFRFKRIADIALDQCRALRVRAFVNFLQKNPASGVYVGTDQSYTSLATELEACGKTVIDTLHITSWDQDHCDFKELQEILSTLKPKKIEYPGYDHDSENAKNCLQEILRYREARREAALSMFARRVDPPYVNGLDEANGLGYTDIIFHPKEIFSGSNDNSTVKLYREGMFNVASLGDVEHANIGSMLRRSRAFKTEVDVLILAHHGSDNDVNSKKFFETVKPTIAVCSSDYDNQYGHPHEDVKEALYEAGVPVFTTKTGDVLVESVPNHRKEYQVTNYKSNTTDISSTKRYVSKKFHLLNANADTIRNCRNPGFKGLK